MSTSWLGLPPTRAAADPDVVGRLRELVAADRLQPVRLPRLDVDTLSATLLAVEDDALARHRSLGLADEVAAATLADVGSKIATYGADADLPWLVGVLRADVVAAGRLQVGRVPDADGAALHIPSGGPLRPPVVDDALQRVRRVVGHAPLHCTSWLFDPALEALGPTSNIRRFAARFDIAQAEPSPEGDVDVCTFVFRRGAPEVLASDDLVLRTSLERLVAGHLRSGAHWSVPRGVLREG